ncbi:hypothetical protein DYB28_003268 [Aphanomyces astaci]|uniref:non-specific serine/threonine protein kinase n=2 Tax=Aphanomyces astaci TaxID=112090 RepID=A0A9X8HBS4_APHAT|nr:hypothetical protein DYB28_003268 [Aphanomyces astaci]
MNKYLEERCIGRGSYGCAYLVTEITSGHKYVVKKIPIELMTDKESKQAFAEVELLSKLRHSFVVQYKENFVEGTVLHIVMEYCDGGDLTARIKALKADDAALFPPTLVLDWFVQMALAIKYLHQRHILHRDLKTSNIFLTRQNIVKLGDFGIARTLDSTMDHAKTVVGTPYYMSPEVCESKPYSYASDIWALGCVLYEVCTLKHAFDAPNILMLIVKIIQHDRGLAWVVTTTTTDEVEEAIDTRHSGGDEVIKPNYESAYSEECSDSIHIDYGLTPPPLSQQPPLHQSMLSRSWLGHKGTRRRQALTLDHRQPPPSSTHALPRHRVEPKKHHILRPHVVGKVLQPSDQQLPPRHPDSPRLKHAGVKLASSMTKRNTSSMSPSSSMSLDEDNMLEARTSQGIIESGDDDGPYTSMSECDAEENFYSDDSDFDDEDLTLETSVDEVVACGGGGGWLSGARQVSAAVELGYSDDFDDTEAEVIEYDNEEFVDDGSSGGSSDEEQGGGDKVDWYNYDEFADPSPPLCMVTPSSPNA